MLEFQQPTAISLFKGPWIRWLIISSPFVTVFIFPFPTICIPMSIGGKQQITSHVFFAFANVWLIANSTNDYLTDGWEEKKTLKILTKFYLSVGIVFRFIISKRKQKKNNQGIFAGLCWCLLTTNLVIYYTWNVINL